jgi:hypothetical protein
MAPLSGLKKKYLEAWAENFWKNSFQPLTTSKWKLKAGNPY